MTFNIELLLEIFKGYLAGFSKVITSENATFDFYKSLVDDSVKRKIDAFEQVFKGIDIACVQENIILPTSDTGIYTNLLNRIGDLRIASSCHSHLFEWDTSKKLYGTDGKLSNSIYANPAFLGGPVEKGTVLCEDSCYLPTMNKTPRCFAEAVIRIEDVPIHIATLHASGGRFDDSKALEPFEGNTSFRSDTSIVNTKIEQVKEVIRRGPDIICGDFNTKLYNGETIDTDSYFKLLMQDRFKQETGKSGPAWDKGWDDEWTMFWSTHKEIRWPFYKTWMYGIDSELIGAGYRRAYGNEIGDTTLYGGTVDMIYYKPEKLVQVSEASRIMEEVMEPKASGFPKYTPILSDHFPVKVQFAVKSV